MKFVKTIFLSTILVLSLSAREQVNVNFTDLEIKDFIKLISKITNKNILINHKVNGKVDFISTSAIYDDELIGILISVLDSKGFTLIKDGSLYKIVRSTDAAKNNAEVVKQGKTLDGSLMVTQAIEVKDENVDVVAAKVRYLISKTAKLMTMKETNTILITDYPKNIETIKAVIKDIAQNNETIVKVVYINNTSLKSLKAQLTNISKSIFNEKIASQKVQIIADENINALVLVGRKQNIEKLEKLVVKLDIESKASKTVQIFPLKNSDAKTTLATLNEILKNQKFADPTRKPNISSSEEINSIIAIGDPIIVKGIKQIIDELDKEKYQVYVQARIIEISDSEAESIGIKYGLSAGDVSASGLYAMSADFGSSALTTAAATAVTSALGAIGSSSTAFALGATLSFLETHGASRSVSNPSILCVNNKESSIYVGKTISVSSGSTSNAVSGITNSYKREDVGLTLKVKPRASSKEKVTLDVEAVLENVLDDGSNNETGQPVTSKQEVKTQAILSHGESIIIGGLVKAYELESVSRVPILGYIPWIGDWLFSSKSVDEQKDNLVVILTPYVIDKSEQLSKLQQELGVLSQIQNDYNDEVFARIEARAEANTEEELIETEEVIEEID